ncbi:MAG TPA: TIGR03118 family protein [Polyangiaceae bacterium]|jgi:uncharacterized protein (TIGR03118 family)|nr:TIGR03118 family protein [Polyangiaceae bacterium]
MTLNAIATRGHGIRLGVTFTAVAGAALAVAACSSDTTPSGSDGGTGGSGASTGGSSSTGGSNASTGGTSGSSSGGGTATGGAAGTATGGATGSGGPDASVPDGGPANGDAGLDGGVVLLVVKQTNLVANMDGVAPTTDPNLLNPWGLVANPTAGAFWVSDNHSGLATVYQPTGGASALNVKVPGPADTDGGFTSSPTGQVFNGTAANFKGDKFIVDSEDGTIEGWQTAGSPFVLRVDNSADSGYKGLALITNGTAGELVAANFHKGTVDVFDASYAPVASPGFVDSGSPALPGGFAPFNVAALGDSVYIAYAKQDDEKGDDVPGGGNGYVSVFKTDGTFVKRLVSGGELNSPWGLAIAPTSFGALAGALLVGNFGNGTVHAYDATTGELRGALSTSTGPLQIGGLWALVVGPKTASADYSSSVFFTAGPDGEADGIFGKLDVSP